MQLLFTLGVTHLFQGRSLYLAGVLKKKTTFFFFLPSYLPVFTYRTRLSGEGFSPLSAHCIVQVRF